MSLKIVDRPIVQPGVERVYTAESFPENKEYTRESAAQYTRELNQPSELRKRFRDIIALFKKILPSGALVETHVPTGGYSPGAVQITALRPDIVDNKQIEMVDGRVPAISIYDLEKDAQVEYFTQILGSMSAVDREYSLYASGKYTVLFTENVMLNVSDVEHRVARSIAEPHAQVWIASGNVLPFKSEENHRLLSRERKLIGMMSDVFENGLGNLQKDMEHTDLEIIPKIRKSAPHGYILETSINKNMSIKEQGVALSDLMQAHHKRYAIEAQKIIKDLEVTHQYMASIMLPQPSYKLFGTFNEDGFLEISVAPSFISSSGVIEVLDRQIDRNPTNEMFFNSVEAEGLYYYGVAKKLDEIS